MTERPLVYEIRRTISRLECSSCGAEANASCDCGKAYVPKAARAADAIRANPEKSDRAIAADIGVDHKTVGKARKSGGECSPPDEVIGRDGKTYPRVAVVADVADEDDIEADIEDPKNYRTAFLLRADQATKFAVYSGPIRKDLVTAARRVAAVWENLAQQMERTNG